MSEQAPIATRTAWNLRDPPAERATLPYATTFSREEHARIVRGIVPARTEDKWFIFHEDGWLYLHRSWTGACIYGVRLEPDGEGSFAAEAWASRATGEYTRTDVDYDARLLSFLVDRLLLGKAVPFPVPEAIDGMERAAHYKHHVVGDARANDEE